MKEKTKLTAMRRIAFALFAMLLSTTVRAQLSNVSGTVIDETGEPVIGASVVEKANVKNGTITNMDGKFMLKVREGAVLTFSYIGFSTQDAKAANGMTVTLREDENTLQDVVVIGYGVQKKSVVTASIAKVSADDLEGKTRLRAEGYGCRRAGHLGLGSAGRQVAHPYPWYRYHQRL